MGSSALAVSGKKGNGVAPIHWKTFYVVVTRPAGSYVLRLSPTS
jgi:hypothetical protein